ncbi:ubiquitin carboxyl-terminal hydrolase 4 [Limosa lapponica baueri]|uniref:ribonuclease H n=1 Tax=Limosa lapponica baueri TaxID=1758121 RepID=A0A2I0TDE4_LIMLA|nr:ubiquitin carboxyl-terminal hydrolase 4 [Limosa lapponica baueri]
MNTTTTATLTMTSAIIPPALTMTTATIPALTTSTVTTPPASTMSTTANQTPSEQADAIDLDNKEVRQLGNLARDGGIDKATGRKSNALSLWRRLVSAVKGRYPFKDDIDCRPSKWTSMEKGIKYLRELSVREVIYGDWQVNVDPDEVPCTRSLLRKFVQSAPSMYSHTFSAMVWGGSDADTPTVKEVTNKVQQYEDSLSRPLTVAAVEKLTEKTEKMTEKMTENNEKRAKKNDKLLDKLFDKLSRMEERSHSSPAWTHIAAVRRRCPPTKPAQEKQNMLQDFLWVCLCNYGEDMRRPQFAFMWRGIQCTWNRLPQGWKHSPTICHGLIQTALEKGGAPEHLRYIDDIIVWGNTAEEVLKKVLGWMFKGKVPSAPHATDATWSKWVALITWQARIGNHNRPGIVEVITNWPEGKDSRIPPEEVVTRAEEAPLCNELSDNEKQYALFTDGSCRIVGKHRRWKLLCGVLHGKSQKLLKDKDNRVNLQR